MDALGHYVHINFFIRRIKFVYTIARTSCNDLDRKIVNPCIKDFYKFKFCNGFQHSDNIIIHLLRF